MRLYSTAVLFAGGKSRRMGEDKALLPFGAYASLTQYQQVRLQKLFKNVYISTKKNKFDFPCQCIIDSYDEASPLVALLSVFEMLDVEEVFVLSVDAPLVDQEVINVLMAEEREEAQVIVSRSPSGVQPLCARYHKSILPYVQTQYKNKNHKLSDLLAIVQTKEIVFSDDKAFTNLNHPQEYQDALKSL